MNELGPSVCRLFSYGTLRLPEVQTALFGRTVTGREDALQGFALAPLAITDPRVIALSGRDEHLVIRRTDDPADEVAGVILELTQAELAAADDYEVDEYARTKVRAKSGVETYVYVLKADLTP